MRNYKCYQQIYENQIFYSYANGILRNLEFQRRKTFLHHQDSVYEHSIRVSLVAFRMSRFLSKYVPLSTHDVVVGALLHDFYLKPWRENKGQLHGFHHGKIARQNAQTIFPSFVNPCVCDSIQKHMFPLTLIPPKYYEGWIIMLADKYVSLEVLKNPKELPRYLGIHNWNIIVYPKKLFFKVRNYFLSI